MTTIEKMRIEAELMRVKSARFDLSLKVAELRENIERIQGQVQIQLDREKDLEAKMNAPDVSDPAAD